MLLTAEATFLLRHMGFTKLLNVSGYHKMWRIVIPESFNHYVSIFADSIYTKML